jgi:hypothetical protein
VYCSVAVEEAKLPSETSTPVVTPPRPNYSPLRVSLSHSLFLPSLLTPLPPLHPPCPSPDIQKYPYSYSISVPSARVVEGPIYAGLDLFHFMPYVQYEILITRWPLFASPLSVIPIWVTLLYCLVYLTQPPYQFFVDIKRSLHIFLRYDLTPSYSNSQDKNT